MILESYAMKDVKAATFGRPVFCAALGQLVRDIQDALKGDDIFARHPEDFVLYRIGRFDDVAGVFTALPMPEFVLDVSSLREAQVRPVGPAAPLAAVSN